MAAGITCGKMGRAACSKDKVQMDGLCLHYLLPGAEAQCIALKILHTVFDPVPDSNHSVNGERRSTHMPS